MGFMTLIVSTWPFAPPLPPVNAVPVLLPAWFITGTGPVAPCGTGKTVPPGVTIKSGALVRTLFASHDRAKNIRNHCDCLRLVSLACPEAEEPILIRAASLCSAFSRVLKKAFSCFDRLSTNGKSPTTSSLPPFALSLSKGERRVFQHPVRSCC